MVALPGGGGGGGGYFCIILYKLLFSRGFYFREFREPDAREKFPLQFMSIYSNDNIRKIAKLTTRELPQKSKNAKITVRENNGLYSIRYIRDVRSGLFLREKSLHMGQYWVPFSDFGVRTHFASSFFSVK